VIQSEIIVFTRIIRVIIKLIQQCYCDPR